jgi:hypothetical protein
MRVCGKCLRSALIDVRAATLTDVGYRLLGVDE